VGGGAGQVPYQSSSGATAFLAAGAAEQVLTSGGAAPPVWRDNRPLTAASINTTLSSFFDFIGIPSWVRRIHVTFNGISTNGSSGYLVQIGSGSVDTAGYVGAATNGNGGAATTSSTAGFYFNRAAIAAATFSGHLTLTLAGSNVWVGSGVGFDTGPSFNVSAANKTLSGALDRLRLTTVNGTDTFDAGSINIMYE
jgi:hypothetical protein